MTYEKGKRYKVIKDGSSLYGERPVAPWTSEGWAMRLYVGDVITCLGESMTRGDGVPALKWGNALGDWLANDCIFAPVQGGMWGGQVPEDGYLEED